ncbi:MAG: cytochrome c [Flavobacteriaceae bacterium]|jgi:mono/diheme cytochrome c family protein|nr:cytochrome c [Flavobacteriaceae bacterium]
MKRGFIYLLLVSVAVSVSSCSDKKRKPSIVFMPDMYYPVAYDPYMEADFEYWPERNGEKSNVSLFNERYQMTALWPAEGSVARTDEQMILPWEFKNTLEDYNKTKAITKSPLDPANRKKDLERGEKLYGQTCTVCHGDTGDGQGSIVQTKAYSGVPTYAEREMSVGSVYHVIMYGKNAMGSYAGQLTPVDRWRVAEYVMNLRAKSLQASGAPAATPTGETETSAGQAETTTE